LWHWGFYGPLSGITFAGFMFFAPGEAWESPSSRAASLAIPYLILNLKKVEFSYPKSILTDSEKEIYKQAYSKKLRQRKFKYAVGSTIVAVVVVSIIFENFSRTFNMSGYDACFDPSCG